MSDVRTKQSPKEITVFEVKIERIRQIGLWGRFFCFLGVVAIALAIVATALKSPLIQVKPTDLGGTIIASIAFYVGSLILDFLADLGLIVLSMKKESQYVSRVVQEVRERGGS